MISKGSSTCRPNYDADHSYLAIDLRKLGAMLMVEVSIATREWGNSGRFLNLSLKYFSVKSLKMGKKRNLKIDMLRIPQL